jgi:CheY-like chemotaxis protein
MESVGRLAGGVAHDVNNLLTPVMCYAEQIASEAGDGSSFLEPAQEILAASRRVRDLVKQLMAFGRVQMLDIRPTSLNTVVSNLERLLRRMLRDDVELVTSLADELPPVLADRTQIDQVVMNLVVNAQDAMPGGGQISIATSHVDVASPPAGAPAELRPGRYACLVVRDNGVGMDPSTRDRVFEPFFTTKEQGKGTGLGLATVYGIVMQHAGHVTVESARDLGTTFRVYWPLVLASPAHPPVPEPDTTPPGGSETILVVEDNPQVRKMVARLLTGLGYSVIVAGSAAEAIGLAAVQGEPIHLLFTDVIMPGGNGVALFDALAPQFPGLKVLYMSGYPRDVAGLREVLDESTPFIEKPFSAARLAVQVRAVIDGDGPAPASTR